MISNLSSALEVCGFMNSQDFKAGDNPASCRSFRGRSQLLAPGGFEVYMSIFPVGLCLPLRQCPASNHMSEMTV